MHAGQGFLADLGEWWHGTSVPREGEQAVWGYLQEGVNQGVRKHFLRPPGQNKEYITAETWRIIGQRDACVNALQALQRRLGEPKLQTKHDEGTLLSNALQRCPGKPEVR